MANHTEILNLLSEIRVPFLADEYKLHEIIETTLQNAGQKFCREYKLGPRSRIDFFVDGIGIEVKRGKPPRQKVVAQLEKYAQYEEIKSMILIINKTISLPQQINQKPCTVLALHKLWGVAW